MEMPVNLLLAAALILAPLVVVAGRRRWGSRIEHYDLLRLISVAIALILAPVNLVFAQSGAVGAFNATVVVASVAGLGVQAALAIQWKRASPSKRGVRGVAEAGPPPVGRLRVVAVGRDADSVAAGAGDAIAAFSRRGHEVFALVEGSQTMIHVPGTERTIIVGAAGASAREEGSAATAEHVARLGPDILLLPGSDEGPASANAHPLSGAAVLRYPVGGADAAQAGPDEATDRVFRRPEADGTLTMPSFSRA